MADTIFLQLFRLRMQRNSNKKDTKVSRYGCKSMQEFINFKLLQIY